MRWNTAQCKQHHNLHRNKLSHWPFPSRGTPKLAHLFSVSILHAKRRGRAREASCLLYQQCHTHLALTPPRPLYTFTQHLLLPNPNFSSAPSPLYSSLAPPQSHHTFQQTLPLPHRCKTTCCEASNIRRGKQGTILQKSVVPIQAPSALAEKLKSQPHSGKSAPGLAHS